MIIQELTLLTDHLAQTEQFYTQHLGLSVLSKEASAVTFAAGETLLRFEASAHRQPRYHFAFNIPYNAILDAFAYMSSKLEILPISETNRIADFANWNAKAFYFYDNNGNIVEFIGRFDLGRHDKPTFTPSAIQSVSEMGLPVENVKEECEKLIARGGFPYFEKQPPCETFSVLGEDTGLLIMVPIGRNWYPTTNIAAEAHPVKLRIRHAGRTVEISTGEYAKNTE
jgi:catechol 2,3-dioxygenase-like lactoylglutathione lyase family enzyme